jgi:hypothetical protein
MRSRILVAAWVLGVLTAAGGSFLAGNAIAQLVTGARTSVGPVQGVGAVHHASISLRAKDSATPQLQPAVIATPHATPRAGSQATPKAGSQPTSQAPPAVPQAAPSSPSPASTGSLIVSPGGSVMASCQSGLAYLQSWTPSQGYQVGDLIRGPAAQARIGFDHLTSESEILVTCNGSNPVGTVTTG